MKINPQISQIFIRCNPLQSAEFAVYFHSSQPEGGTPQTMKISPQIAQISQI
jgi:hypothetical protein